jgi:hypothetical protein
MCQEPFLQTLSAIISFDPVSISRRHYPYFTDWEIEEQGC